MKLSQKIAAQIVDAVHEVVQNDINFISDSGIIIAATNPKRIGDYHEAGAQAVKDRKAVVVEHSDAYQGTQNGINYPIFHEDHPIAAIGITGAPKELHKYGFLITKITEVFLKEQQLSEELISKNRFLHYLITSLIQEDTPDLERLQTILERYSISLADTYTVLSIKLIDFSVEQELSFYFSSLGCPLSLYLYPNEWVAILSEENRRNMDAAAFLSQFGGKLHAGLGSAHSLYHAKTSYLNAQIARQHAHNRGLTFCSSEDISIEFILDSISKDLQLAYAAQILKNLSAPDRYLLRTYFSKNLSLKDTAAALFIHKNTLQYKLDKIQGKCGLNPRLFQDAFLLQFALLCD